MLCDVLALDEDAFGSDVLVALLGEELETSPVDGFAGFGPDVFSGSSECLTWPSKIAFGWMLSEA